MTAKGYTVNLSDPAAVKAAIATTQHDLGPTSLLFWNPVGPSAPFQTATPDQTISAFNTTVTGGWLAVQSLSNCC
jgi:NAD(P)-dependent dehydrogenase (short-subunit alcohol dehydrogenase family)